MTKLVSIDSSTKKTGMALFIDGELKEYTLLDHEKVRDVDVRMNLMIRDILEKLQEWKPDIVYIEEPKGEGQNVAMVKKLSEIIGAVRAWCVWKNREYFEIQPSQWRKWCGIPQGRGVKREVLKAAAMDFVKKHFGIDTNDDTADSICIGVSSINFYNSIDEEGE